MFLSRPFTQLKIDDGGEIIWDRAKSPGLEPADPKSHTLQNRPLTTKRP